MKLMHDRRMPIEIPIEQSAHGNLRVIYVTVVVVKDVLAPERRPAESFIFVLLVSFVAIIPINIAVAPIRLRRRRYGDNDVIAYLFDDWRIFGRQTISHLHKHLRRAGLAAVQPAHYV